ncbi:lipase secretion chaperone [Acinetobacter stercoris]|uniref:Lipase chaperone n=1 Tax=Acinetobacter stercoris TaxID=2126983 RepID=A0A2U3N417_9GAMM|nr:lipase secretion chaperone [Acinetobacter stercoris]SPL72418.1 Lipase chaperone [Acinetobacter stercoris]
MEEIIRHKKYVLLVLVLLLFLAVFLYLKPKSSKNTMANVIVDPGVHELNTPQPIDTIQQTPLKFNGVMPVLAPSLRGTEVNCPLQVNTKGQLVLSMGIRDCFDYFLSSEGEKTRANLILDIRQYLTGLLPATAQPYAFQLLDKYIDYLNQLRNLSPVKDGNIESYRAVSSAVTKLRRQIFTTREADVFFAQEEQYDQYAIAQYAINNDKSLTTEEKAQKSAELLNQQPAELVESMRPIIQFNQLQELTAEIKARGGSEAELYQMRKNLVGEAAAKRLEKVDLQEGQWQQKIDQYLAERDRIIANQQNINQQSAINELKSSAFKTPEERLRVEAYEQMHDAKNN